MAGERALSADSRDDQPLEVRAFCGRIPWPLISELAEGDEVVGCYVVLESRKLQTKNNQPYLRLVLGDRSGTIEAVIWDDAERLEIVCALKEVVGVRGRFSVYQDKPQLRVGSVERVRASGAEMEYLIPASRRDRELMERELDAQIASVKDRPLRALLRRCLGRDSAMGRAFREHPAATRNHHAYLFGLLEHTLSVTGICERLVEHYREQGIFLDRDLLVAGALLHDIGKTQELEGPPSPSYTTAGKLLGHIVLGIHMVGREGAEVPDLSEDRLLLLQHLIASHQGKPEWDSPRVPQMLEALVLHYADDLDAKMNQASSTLTGVDPGAWSDYDRSLARSFYRPKNLAGEGSGSASGLSETVIDLFKG